MGKIIIQGGGVNLEEVTALPGDIVKGKTAYTQGSDDPTTGTLRLDGNAQAAHVLAGETFYTTDPKTKQTGTLVVNSLLSFSVAAYSGRRVLAKWQNPNQAAGKPFSGVIIRYSTSSYPGTTGGTQIYKGAGNNTAAGGWSQAYMDLPNLSTKYYLSIYPYVTCNAGEITGAAINAAVTTSAVIDKTFTASGSYTIPAGYAKIDIFCVGGGSGGGGYTDNGGGGGGYTKTVKGIAVSVGQVLAAVVGSGGAGGNRSVSGAVGTAGGSSYVTRNGTTLINAAGGTIVSAGYAGNPGRDGRDGGSGGGANTNDANGTEGTGKQSGKNGGSNGGDGGSADDGKYYFGGKGQGTTTRAWGLSAGTLYAGGGGGGARGHNGKVIEYPGNGGAGGGGKGGQSGYWSGDNLPGNAGTANTGGGGGGAGYNGYQDLYAKGGDGGSGIILLKLY